MSNGYFTHTTPLARHTLARAEELNATLSAVAAGFDRLPAEAVLKQGRTDYAAASGTANSYALTLPFPPDAYSEGLRIAFRVPAANTGGSTVNVNGLGVKPLRRADGGDTTAGDLPGGAVIEARYDGAVFRLTGVQGGDVARAAASAASATADAGIAAAQVVLTADHATAAAQSAANAAASAALAAANAAVAAGQDAKASVRVGTTANTTLSGEQTIQGVALVTGDRVLVKAQANAAGNGIYVVRAGAWERAPDMDAWAEVPCAFTFVEEGAEADTGWVCTSNPGGTLGVTAVTWARYTVALSTVAPSPPGPTAQVGTSGQAVRADHVHAYQEEWVTIAISDEVTPLTTGAAKVVWRAPYPLALTRPPRASLSVASSGGAVVVNVKEAGTTVLSNKVILDQGARTSTTAGTQPIITDASIADDAEVSFDIDSAGTGAKGLKVTLYFRRAS